MPLFHFDHVNPEAPTPATSNVISVSKSESEQEHDDIFAKHRKYLIIRKGHENFIAS